MGSVRNIIAKEKPDAILPTMGGQTALNCALDLNKYGVLDEFNVELIGASADAIDKAEDRERFDKAMKSIGLECPRAEIAHTIEQARDVLSRIPVILLPLLQHKPLPTKNSRLCVTPLWQYYARLALKQAVQTYSSVWTQIPVVWSSLK
jgi:hypothetical protein